MEKKEMKIYEAPQMEVVEMDFEAVILADSNGYPDNVEGGNDL